MKPRILVITHGLNFGGTERVIEALHNNIDFEQSIVCLDNKGAIWERLAKKSAKLFFLNRKPGIDIGTIFKLARIIKNVNPNIIHAHQYTAFFYALLALLISFRKTKLLFTEHGRHYPDFVSKKRRFFNKVFAWRINKITAVSEFSKKQLIEQEGFFKDDIAVIYNSFIPDDSLATQDFVQEKLKELKQTGKFIIGYLGSLRAVKNPELLINAFAELESKENLNLVLIGEGPLQKQLELRCRELDIQANCKLLGSTSSPSTCLKEFDCLVLPSLSEACPLVILEAFYLRIPVLASATGGIPELINDQFNGLLFKNNSSEDLSDKLQLIITNSELREIIKNNAETCFKEKYNSEKFYTAYKKIYQELNNA